MIRIAYVLTAVEFGGIEKVTLNIVKNIDRGRFLIDPILLVRPWEAKNTFMNELENAQYKYQAIPVAKNEGCKDQDVWRVPRSFGILYGKLKKGQYHIVHTNGYYPDIIGIPAARLLGLQSISTCHGFLKNNVRLSFYNFLNTLILRYSGRIMCVSEELKCTLCSRGIKKERIEVMPNAVELQNDAEKARFGREEVRQRYGIRYDETVLGYVGRLSNEKGLDRLLEAANELDLIHGNIRVLIVGEGAERERLEKKSLSMGFFRKVDFAGFQSECVKYFAAMDVFVLPSFTEGTPLVVLEAMSMGIPVVASSVGEIPRMISSGETGMLVQPGDILGMVKAVQKILSDKKETTLMTLRAIEHVAHEYGMTKWICRLEDIYQDVYRGGRRSKTVLRSQ